MVGSLKLILKVRVKFNIQTIGLSNIIGICLSLFNSNSYHSRYDMTPFKALYTKGLEIL